MNAELKFTENGTEGRPAFALIATKAVNITDPEKPGMGRKIRVQAGYVRAIRLIPQADLGGRRFAEKELRAIVTSQNGIGKSWRIAEGTA